MITEIARIVISLTGSLSRCINLRYSSRVRPRCCSSWARNLPPDSNPSRRASFSTSSADSGTASSVRLWTMRKSALHAQQEVVARPQRRLLRRLQQPRRPQRRQRLPGVRSPAVPAGALPCAS